MILSYNVPIVIICKDRIRYLDQELKSICKTTPPSTQVFVSNDGTTKKNTLVYLTTNLLASLSEDHPFPLDHEEWNKYIGVIPNETSAKGVLGKVNVILHPESAGTQNLGKAVKHAFESSHAEYVIKMEDDMLCTPNWYYNLIHAISHSDCDLVSGFRYFYGKAITKPMNPFTEEVVQGYTGGQTMIASRKYYDKCPYVFNNEIKTIWDNDDLWINQCRKANLKFGVTKQSVCQHVGFVTESTQSEFTRGGTLSKIDKKLKTFVLGSEVTPMGKCNERIDGRKIN